MIRRLVLIASLATVTILAFSAPASATYHFNLIRQIHPSNGINGGEWVELQAFADGQNLISGNAWIRTFNSTDQLQSQYLITGSNPLNGRSQRTILISSLVSPAGVDADFVAPVAQLQMTGQDGAVCFTHNDPPAYTPIDCVAYGNYMGSLPGVGTPAAATPFESTLERSITKGCGTALDTADDTDNSTADFALSTSPPRNNSATPTEMPCATTPPGNPASPVNPAGNVRKRKCKKKQKRSVEIAKKKKCKKKKKR
ncbi:MAG TPA: hypothetical protein VLB79_12070 [Solirubrobacterales bacterium]|nr:hypothetical protein [Solirubrobacterales bacterium]